MSRCDLRPRIVFLLPTPGGGGGGISVVQETLGMRCLGVRASIAVPRRYLRKLKANHPQLSQIKDLVLAYRSESQLLDSVRDAHVFVATANATVSSVKQIASATAGLLAYYVQDYEPFFYPLGSSRRRVAEDSYALAAGGVLFAKTNWVRSMVEERHAVKVMKVRPSIDLALYYPETRCGTSENEPLVITAMVRPGSPWRSPQLTLDVLRRCQERYGRKVEMHTFGCPRLHPRYLQLEKAFPHQHHGVLVREDVAELLRRTAVFVDLSEWQAFGRTGLEAMASGATSVLPECGGVEEYAKHGVNALLTDTSDPQQCFETTCRMIEDADLRQRLTSAAITTATSFSVANAAVSEVRLLLNEWNIRNRHSQFDLSELPPMTQSVSVLAARSEDN